MKKFFTKVSTAIVAILALTPFAATANSVTAVNPAPATTSADGLGSVTTYTVTCAENISGVDILNIRCSGKYTATYGEFGGTATVSTNGNTVTISTADGNWDSYIEKAKSEGATAVEFILAGFNGFTTDVEGTSFDTFGAGYLYLTYKFGEVENPNKVQEINNGQNGPFNITYNTVWAFTPSESGELVIYNTSSTSNVSGSGGIVFTDAAHTNAVESTNGTDWDYNDEQGAYKYTMQVEGGKTYYVYFSYFMYSGTYSFLFNLNYQEEVEAPEDIELEAGTATPLLKGQKGLIYLPSEIPVRGTLVVQLTANTTADLGSFFYNNIYSTAQQPISTETVGQTTVYTFSSAASYGPWYVLQDAVESVTFTLAFPQLNPTIVELDKEFAAVAGQNYKFTVEDPMILNVKSSVALTEAQWYKLLYNNPGQANAMACETEVPADGINNVTFRLQSSGDYYLTPTEDASFTLSQVTQEAKDPFGDEASLVAPLEGVETASMFIVTWNQHLLDPAASLLSGAKITNPQGVELIVNRPTITSATDNGANDAVSLGIDNDQITAGYASVRGQYTVFLPEGFAYDTEGHPSPETTLYYDLGPTAGEGEATYFNDIETYDNIPETYLLSTIQNYIVTYPFELSYVDDDAFYIDVTVNDEPGVAEVSGDQLNVYVGLTAKDENLDVRINFQKGLFKNDAGEVNPPTTFMFKLYAPIEEATVTPDSGATLYADSESKEVEVVWSDWMMTSFNNEDGEFENSGISLIGANGAIPLAFYSNFNFNDAGNGFVFDFSDLEAGTYTINIPAGCVALATLEGDMFDGNVINGLNAAVNVTIIVSDQNAPSSAIDSINAIDGDAQIFNLQGVKVNNGKLAPGLYIVNGKKVMMK